MNEPIKNLIESSLVVFAYATLLKRSIRNKVIKADVKLHKDILPNYKRITNLDTDEGKEYDTVVPAPGKKVLGDWFTVTTGELKTLDKYEDEYMRKLVTLESGTRAFVYILRDKDILEK
jgi:gamma-glutamylcyclotransferase (GGCT)/AIG2-like uncharacterized protein YtfP